ncbi:response regulator transcription factor [Undibacterium sp. LX40W]|uniref:Response regulator transcription factor n=1 Tax=Undibacterium nitidum TaxID=2762298 RepID=A0A923KLJ1_9BURK|nr:MULTISPECIES: LytTR family DNA-binding domain-containing protein [Undibacterium]MBC3881910.1 response regulator transcription factor [Undibacterium nitidum]MBC3892093.1 response regulator transcription factor [Undibacterium sp. LX40W]
MSENKTYKVLIVDDELPALTNMQYVLSQHPQWQLVASCHSSAQARAILNSESIDLLLLDIEMPVQSGLDFARELSRTANPPLIVFITAYNKHAVSAFEVFALDYLLKPYDDERFAAMLARAENSLQMKQQLAQGGALQDFFREHDAEQSGAEKPLLSHVVVRSMGRIERIEVHEVLWLSTAANYVEIHLHQRVVLHRTTLSAMEERLDKQEFIRVHRTAIVRIGAIRSLEIGSDGTYFALLLNGDQVRISESYLKAVKQKFSQ